ncbi:MAG: hypothetical protein KGL44_07880 [Sphingomonadales bacterium]|nr:hypothetical protein [Sphingomonadales bacterium]
MFTGNKIGLKLCADAVGANAERDCAFSYIGKIPTRLRDRVVPCATSSHIAQAIDAEGIVGIVTKPEHADLVPEHMGLMVSASPQATAYAIHEYIAAIPGFQWAEFDSVVDETAVIETGAIIAPRNVRIGAGTVVMSGAIVRERSIVRENCRIGSGTVVGCDAYEINQNIRPTMIVRQSGGVLIEKNAELLANCTISRTAFGGFTRIGEESKLDCLVYLAHDCSIGKRVQIAACVDVSGRVVIGDDVYIGPNATISNGLTIHEGAFITMGSVVTQDVGARQKVTGNFAIPHGKFLNFLKSIIKD